VELKRQQPIVEAYHFDMKPKDKEMETKLNVGFAPLKVKDSIYSFPLVSSSCLLSAAVLHALLCLKVYF